MAALARVLRWPQELEGLERGHGRLPWLALRLLAPGHLTFLPRPLESRGLCPPCLSTSLLPPAGRSSWWPALGSTLPPDCWPYRDGRSPPTPGTCGAAPAPHCCRHVCKHTHTHAHVCTHAGSRGLGPTHILQVPQWPPAAGGSPAPSLCQVPHSPRMDPQTASAKGPEAHEASPGLAPAGLQTSTCTSEGPGPPPGPQPLPEQR